MIEMWECHFRAYCLQHPDIYKIMQEARSSFAQRHKGALTHEQIISSVRSKDFFGMVECDIEVPEEWDPEFRGQTDLTPKEYFSEMCSLFCNSEVTFDLIGEHMQQHAREHGLSEGLRRMLIGGMNA